MRAWYDIAGPELDRQADEEGVRKSAGIARALVDEQIARGIVGERIVLAGFSQGGAIALYAGLRFPFRVAGVLALSTYLPAAKSLASEMHPANRDVPIFLAHGSQDPVIALALSECSRAAMADPRIHRRGPYLPDAPLGLRGGSQGRRELAAASARPRMTGGRRGPEQGTDSRPASAIRWTGPGTRNALVRRRRGMRVSGPNRGGVPGSGRRREIGVDILCRGVATVVVTPHPSHSPSGQPQALHHGYAIRYQAVRERMP